MLSSFLTFLCSIGILGTSFCPEPVPPAHPLIDETLKSELIFSEEKEDDWDLDLSGTHNDSFLGRSQQGFRGGIHNTMNRMTGMGAPMMEMAAPAPIATKMVSDTLGFAVGGAKDINNFRENVKKKKLPLPSDVTYEGLFYDYFFETGDREACEDLFCPTYATATAFDPFTKEESYYLSVGLNSNISEADFERKKLNLMVVLDISGSMGSPFDEYYYDNPAKHDSEIDREDRNKTKMQLANESIIALTEHLRPEDRFGMVVFDDQAYRAKPMNLVGNTDMDAIRNHIADITDQGGTNMESGFKKGTELLEDLDDVDGSEYETRIIFLTDAMPNTGQIREESLFGMMEKNARQQIYTTFIGIGLDFNSELIESITKVRGANYHSVHSASEFKQLLDDDFEYMVTPLVFGLTLRLESEDVDIVKVYGSPEADEATGEIMKVNTLFPSRTEEGDVKGGLILIQLDGDPAAADLDVSVHYEDRQGKMHVSSDSIEWDIDEVPSFDHTGVRKGVLLTQYANLLINWLREERSTIEYKRPDPLPIPHPTPFPMSPYEYFCPMDIMPRHGICIPPMIEPRLGKWERQSKPLTMSLSATKLFQDFTDYFESEMEMIGDDNLSQELEVLHKLIGVNDSQDS